MPSNPSESAAGIDIPDPGWRPLAMPRSFGEGRSFVSGEVEGDRLLIHYYQRESDQALCAKVWFGLGAEGPPGHAHGGSMAAVMDEAMGFVGWVAGFPVVAASITIHFRRKLPLGKVLIVEAWIDRKEAGKVYTKGKIHDPGTGHVFCEGEGTFIERPMDYFGALGQNVHTSRKDIA